MCMNLGSQNELFQSFYLLPRNPGLANNLRSLVNGQAGKAYSKLTGIG